MKLWFTSLTGAVVLSFIALIVQVFRALLDFGLVYTNLGANKDTVILAAAIYMVVFGVWAGGLLAGTAGRRAGLMAAFGVGLLFWLGLDWTTILPITCPNGCDTPWFYVAAGIGLVVGGLALISLGLQIWRARPIPTQIKKENLL